MYVCLNIVHICEYNWVFIQERNIFNRIFGGFLMRKAYELGRANACVFA